MADESKTDQPSQPRQAGVPVAEGPDIETTPGPHLVDRPFTTRRMMVDVLIGLAPAMAAAVWFFRQHAVIQVAVCVAAALATEAVFCWARRRKPSLLDGSAVVTGVILAFSLPPKLPLYATVMGAVAAIGLGKMVFGGLGYNIFNPAMVGRAFLMACFAGPMTSWVAPKTLDAMTTATPLAGAVSKVAAAVIPTSLVPLLTGNVSGCLGETSAAMILLGGLWVLIRRAGDWRLTAGMLLGVSLVAGIEQLAKPAGHSLGVAGHLAAGGAMLAAFFIVTDPVTTPLTRLGRWIFGLGVGILVVLIRLFSNLPEGVMYAVLVMNAVSPLLNRWTAPRPVGGHVPRPVAS